MALRAILRSLPSTPYPHKFPFLSPTLLPRLFSTEADRYSHLLFRPTTTAAAVPNLERALSLSLTKSTSNLHASTVESVLHHCTSSSSADPSLLLRFFVWAGLQPSYRHGAATYCKACNCLRLSRHPNAIGDLLDDYSKDGTPVSLRTFKILLDLCRQANLPDQALIVLKRMGEFSCRPDTAAYNIVLRLLVNGGCGDRNVDVAGRLLEEMALSGILPDMVTYVLMVKGLCRANRLETARALVVRMRAHGCVPNVVVYSALVDGACKCGNLDAAMELLGEMGVEVEGSVPNVVTYTCLIQCLCEKGRVEEAVRVFDRMVRQGCYPNRVTVVTLLQALCREGLIDEAYGLVERVVVERSLSGEECYSSLVVCLLAGLDVEEAEKLVGRMLANGVQPDGKARNFLVKELCCKGRYLDGFSWVSKMWMEGLSFDSDSYSVLMMGLCEGGHLVELVSAAKGLIERGDRIGSSCVDAVVEPLRKCGEIDLAMQIMRTKET